MTKGGFHVFDNPEERRAALRSESVEGKKDATDVDVMGATEGRLMAVRNVV